VRIAASSYPSIIIDFQGVHMRCSRLRRVVGFGVVAVLAAASGLATAVSTAKPAAAAVPAPGFEIEVTLTDGPVAADGSADLQVSPDGLWTVFAQDGLRSVPTAGGRARLLDATAGTGFTRAYAISPDSSRVVYEDEAGLASQAIGGSSEARIATPGVLIEWSIGRDGYVVLQVLRPGTVDQYDLYSVPIDGGPATQLNAVGTDVQSFYAPSFGLVIFAASVGGGPTVVSDIDPNRRDPIELLTLPAGEEVVAFAGGPDDTTIVMNTVATVGGVPHEDLVVLGANDVVTRVAPSSLGASLVEGGWAVDSQAALAYVDGPSGQELVRVNRDGIGRQVLATPPAGSNFVGAPIPGPSHVLFKIQRASGLFLETVKLDGTGQATLLSDLATDLLHDVAISPNGLTVVAAVRDGVGFVTMQMPVDASIAPSVIARFLSGPVEFTTDGSSVILSRKGRPYLAALVGPESAVPISADSGFTDTLDFVVTPGGHRVIVAQDRKADGAYGLYSFGPSYADGAHTAFVPVSPVRVLDTRPSGQIGYSGAKPGAKSVVRLPIRGASGVPNTADIKAVVLNVTAVDATAGGYVTVWPTGTAVPTASNVNVEQPGQTRPNLVTVQIGADGSVSLFTDTGTHLLADLAGYYTVKAAATAGRWFPLTPKRVLDTRGGGRPAAGATVRLPLLGHGGVPNTGVSAVVLSVTATDGDDAGYVTVWPSGLARPVVSNLNIERAGQSIANQVIVPVGADGAVSLFTDRGTHLIADVAGWYTDASELAGTSGLFLPQEPTRVVDTRLPTRFSPAYKPKARESAYYGAEGFVSGVLANVTMAEATAPGFVTVFPYDRSFPTASNINANNVGQTMANHVLTAVGLANQIQVFTSGGAELIVDINGTFNR
jgi:hypothetical protein